jgi:hypothetical protein
MKQLEAERASKIAEISGWDTEENFFVEKAILHRQSGGNQKAGIYARLRVGSLVFIRVPDEASMDRTVPVTYQVSGIVSTNRNGAHEVCLTRLRPRESTGGTMLQFSFREASPN